MNNQSDHRPFIISSIDVDYEYNTDSPTVSPTITPSPTLTRSPTLSIDIVEAESTPNTESSDIDRFKNLSTTTLWREHIADSESENVSPSIYVVIIAILSALLCIVTTLLILNVVRSKRVVKEGFADSSTS